MQRPRSGFKGSCSGLQFCGADKVVRWQCSSVSFHLLTSAATDRQARICSGLVVDRAGIVCCLLGPLRNSEMLAPVFLGRSKSKGLVIVRGAWWNWTAAGCYSPFHSVPVPAVSVKELRIIQHGES